MSILAAPIGFYLPLIGAALFGEIYRESAAALPASTGAETDSTDEESTKE